MFLANIFGSFFSYEAKQIGENNGFSDKLISSVLSYGAIASGLTRLIMGYLHDFVGFKILIGFLMLVNVAINILSFVF